MPLSSCNFYGPAIIILHTISTKTLDPRIKKRFTSTLSHPNNKTTLLGSSFTYPHAVPKHPNSIVSSQVTLHTSPNFIRSTLGLRVDTRTSVTGAERDVFGGWENSTDWIWIGVGETRGVRIDWKSGHPDFVFGSQSVSYTVYEQKM